MKKNCFTLLMAALPAFFISQNTSAQSDYVNLVKINPFSLLVANITLFYEKQVSDCASLQLGINFMPEPIKTFGPSFSCYGITPEVRFYLSTQSIDAPGGGYIAPFWRYRCITITEYIPNPDNAGKFANETVQDDQFALGFVLGFQHITEKNHVFDFFAGPFSNTNNIHTFSGQILNVDMGQLGNNGIGFRIGATIGLAF